MYCPGCRDDFRPGITVCPECELVLVVELAAPQEPKRQLLVCVYRCCDPGLLLVAESLLIDASIRYTRSSDLGSSDRLQGLFGPVGVDFDQGAGAASIWVEEECSHEAFQLLSRLKDDSTPPN